MQLQQIQVAAPTPLHRLAPNLVERPLAPAHGSDFSAIAAGAVASIPQTLAYGLIIGHALGGDYSGVGIIAALYGSVIVGLLAVLLGGCPFLVAGPRASTLLVFAALVVQLKETAALGALADPTLAAFVLACAATTLAGLLQAVFAVLRIGNLAYYIPLPVVAGFINGSALLIFMSQIWPATGIPAQASLLDLPRHLAELRPGTLALTAATVAIVFLVRRRIKTGASVLVAIVAANFLYLAGSALGFGAALGGGLPSLPAHAQLGFIGRDLVSLLAGPQLGELLKLLLPAAVSMAILSSLDTLLATAAVDEITLRHSNAGRQLLAEGVGNMAAALFSCLPGSSSMVRTQAALNGGMKSAATPIGIAVVVLVVAAFLGAFLPWISQAVMAGLLIALGIDLVDKWTLARMRGLFEDNAAPLVAAADLFVMLVVVLVTMAANLATAVGVGMAVALVSFVLQMARSPVRRSYRATALLARINGDLVRRRFIESHGRRIAVLELEGALFFGSSAELKRQVDDLFDAGIRHVALDLKRVRDVDATGARTLERLSRKFTLGGGLLALGYVSRERRLSRINVFGAPRKEHAFEARRIWLKLSWLGTVAAVGEGHIFPDIDSAVACCEAHLATHLPPGTTTPRGPLRPPVLRGLTRTMLRRLHPYVTRRIFVPGETVFSQGDGPDAAYLLVRGRVDVLLDLPGAERKLKVQTLGSGTIFGEMALLDPQPRSASVVAQEESVCYAISAANMQTLTRDCGDIAVTLLGNVAVIFAERLRAANAMMSELEA